MNKFYFIFLLSLIFACGTSKKKQNTKVKTLKAKEIISIKDSVISTYLYNTNKTDSSLLELHYQFYIQTDSIWKKNANKTIKQSVFEATHFEEEKLDTLEITDDFFKKCLESFRQVAISTNADTEFPSLWNYNGMIQITDNLKNICNVQISSSSYTGGAHGNFNLNFFNFNKFSGKKLLLNDIITDSLAFREIAETNFRTHNNFSPEDNFEELGFWFESGIFSCNNNFILNRDGFTFFFNNYEIAPYSFGFFEFKIPYFQIKELLKEEYRY